MISNFTDINFKQIIPRLGSKNEAFEELCCQLAYRVTKGQSQRLHGAGGDGGIECFLDTPAGRLGWQAKYVFDANALIKQANMSLTTALAVHPTLTRFTLCFPFNLTGPTKRRGKSGIEKMDAWTVKVEESTRNTGRQLTIETWPLSKLLNLLLKHDSSGGLRYYFFGTVALSDDWFSEHLQRAFAAAGPRYTPELNVDTDLNRWIAAFGREPDWANSVGSNLSPLRQAEENLRTILGTNDDGQNWPASTHNTTRFLADRLRTAIGILEDPAVTTAEQSRALLEELSCLGSNLRIVEETLARDIDDKHGRGSADSSGWRQWMAEYEVSFPAAHLDYLRSLTKAIDTFVSWFQSPHCSLAFQQQFVLAGDPGIGKTHGICDAAKRRQTDGLRTCIVFGHKFGNQTNLWTRVAEALNLPSFLGTDCLLDCLNAAGEASGSHLLLCIDAINETRPPSYWKDNIASMIESVRKRPYLRLCLVCKTTYLTSCLPDNTACRVVTHRGFANMERQGCQAFFAHFGLLPPIAPILQPELANPLYLRLVCETMRNAGMDRLPPGWSGSGTAIIREFLNQKGRQFADRFETANSTVPTICLMKIVKKIADLRATSLPWSIARQLIVSEVTDADAVLTWLVNEALLIEDISDSESWDHQIVLRPSFERLGDFLIATEVLSCGPEGELSETQAKKLLYPWLKDTDTIQTFRGILGELAVLVAEKAPCLELPDLAHDPGTYDCLVGIAVNALTFRDPQSLTSSTVELIRHALSKPALFNDAMDAVLNCSWRRSCIDAIWIHQILSSISMHERDAFLCPYLHDSLESSSTVEKLIAAADELPLDNTESEVAERWVIALLWFTAAADRRVKDRATRAATSILTSVASIVPDIVFRFIDIDDDEVRGRVLLSCYGAMLTTRNAEITYQTASGLYQRYVDTPTSFDNAEIRDLIRCICELTIELLPDASQAILPEAISEQPASSDWPLTLPSDRDVEKWRKSLRFGPDEFLSDFFKYSMNCLRPWEHGLSKRDMGKWIAHRIACDFSFVHSQCEHYDDMTLDKYGGGRGKPVWAERIAKKYAWIALNQLGSRLHDHIDRRLESWEQNHDRAPLILSSTRKLDPTLSDPIASSISTEHGWTVFRPRDLDTIDAELNSDFQSWVEKGTVPTLKDIAEPQSFGSRYCRPLLAYFDWDGAEKHCEEFDLHRHLWINLLGYLVPSDQVAYAYERLCDQDQFGRSPNALTFYDGFVAEYPWSTVYDVSEEDNPAKLLKSAAWSTIGCEWGYDVTRENMNVHAPSRELFDGDLWWDGNGGFASSDGSAVFWDPSFIGAEPTGLLADTDFLNYQLRTKGLAIVLIMFGEKTVRADQFGQIPDLQSRTFSQVGYLNGTTQRFGRLRED